LNGHFKQFKQFKHSIQRWALFSVQHPTLHPTLNIFMNSGELREKFLKFFEKRGHKIVPSSSLLPTDPTVLFTTAGMQQFKDYYTGKPSPYGNRVCSVQKCFRTSDIDEVGDSQHLTFLEMLGNFAFQSDYFKKEAIAWALDFLISEAGLSKLKIWATTFKGDKDVPEDKESREIWQKLGIPQERIFGFGREDNFWGPTGKEGPCGPTTEIHYDLTEKPCKKGKKCRPNCECGRFLELWNLVFNEYYQDAKRGLTPLGENEEEKLILKALKGGALPIDKIIEKTGLAPALVIGTLTIMESRAKVKNLGSNTYTLPG